MRNHRLLVLASFICLATFSGCVRDNVQPEAASDLKLLGQPTQASIDTDEKVLGSTTSAKEASEAATSIEKLPTTLALYTSKGTIAIELFPEVAPTTIRNYLAKAATGFYEGLTFHRVEDWVIQGGDPEGTGRGGGTIPTELSDIPFQEGSFGVARGQDIRVSNDAQFFICTADCSHLTGQYTIVGQVSEGMDVAKSIQIGDTIESLVFK